MFIQNWLKVKLENYKFENQAFTFIQIELNTLNSIQLKMSYRKTFAYDIDDHDLQIHSTMDLVLKHSNFYYFQKRTK